MGILGSMIGGSYPRQRALTQLEMQDEQNQQQQANPVAAAPVPSLAGVGPRAPLDIPASAPIQSSSADPYFSIINGSNAQGWDSSGGRVQMNQSAPTTPISGGGATPYRERENAVQAMQTLGMFNPVGSIPLPNVEGLTPAQRAHAESNYASAVATAAGQNQGNGVNMLGEMMRNQLGQGQLSLEQQRALGVGGIGGTIANADRDSRSLQDSRVKENERYGESARYDAMYQNLLSQFPPGTPPDVRMRSLQSRHINPPEYMARQSSPLSGARSGATGAGGTPRIDLNAPRDVQTPEAVIENALSSMPVDPATGRRQRPAAGTPEANMAITRSLAAIPADDALRAQWPAMQQQLIDTFGNDALDQWISQSNNLASLGATGRQHQTQIQRLLRMAGMSQTPITPFSPGLNPLQRAAAVVTYPFSQLDTTPGSGLGR